MESLASQFPQTGPIDLAQLARACEAAAAAAESADGAAAAIEGALQVLHDELGSASVAALVIEHGRLWSVGVRGYQMIPDGLPLDEGVLGRAVRTSSVQLVLDVTRDPDFVEVLRNIASELTIPLVASNGIIGIINVETTTRLPEGGEKVVGPLVAALLAPIEEVRAARTVDLSSLARLFVHMSSLRDPLAIAELAVGSLGRVLPIETSQLLLHAENDQIGGAEEWQAIHGGGPEPIPRAALQALRERIDQSAVFELLDTSMMHVPELVGSRVRSVVLIPLRANGQEVGLLAGASRFAKEFDRGQGELAALLAAHTAASLDSALALARERRSAHTDALTGLLNRRGFEEELDRELAEAQDGRRPLSLVVFDCDDFKDVNDRAGHQFGDALLREIGLVLARTCPEGAAAARLGGDEFVIMLPSTDVEVGLEIADRLRTQLAEGLDEAGYPLRLSAGGSTYPYDGGAASHLLRAADQALYQAKSGGKNRVVGFRDVVLSTRAEASTSGALERSRASGLDGSMLADAMDASAAIWAEESVEGVLDRLSKAAVFVVGATAVQISKVEGSRIADVASHAMRDVDLGEESAYLIADFPVTKQVLEEGVARSLSFLDEDLDGAEAFVLRELHMNSVLLLPLEVHGSSWGLVEIYDMRLRRFGREEEAVARFLVGQAGRRIESLGGTVSSKRRLPLFRLPPA